MTLGAQKKRYKVRLEHLARVVKPAWAHQPLFPNKGYRSKEEVLTVPIRDNGHGTTDPKGTTQMTEEWGH
jgi:hypothetical protein